MSRIYDKKERNIFLIIIIFLIVSFFLTKITNNVAMRELKKDYEDDWAMFNYGQNIAGVAGQKGLDLNILPAWEITKGSEDIIVAVIDTGVDINCEVFNNNTILPGYDFYNYDDTIYDEYIYDYHGTYVCSTIARVAPNVSIIPIKFMEATSGTIEDAILGIKYAIDNGADIINCSWNIYDNNEELYRVIKENPSVLFVCAAGNYSANLDEISIYPCEYKLDNMINVMAIDSSGNRHSTSGYGMATVDIAAPGENVKVWLPENDTVFIGGTSVATAFVTATAALMLSENKNLNPVDIKEMVIASSSKIASLEMLCKSGGCVNIYESLRTCNK